MKKAILGVLCWFLVFFAQAEPLPVDKAFQLAVYQIGSNNFLLNWQIEKGYYLYVSSLKLSTKEAKILELAQLNLPKGLKNKAQNGVTYSVYRDNLSVPVAVLAKNAGEALLEVEYQGCSDQGFCYPAEAQKLKLSINDEHALTAVQLEQANPKTIVETVKKKEQDLKPVAEFSQTWIFDQHVVVMFFIFFGLGLLLSFTPCVLPMVPVLSGIIVGHGELISTRKAFFLSLSYVLSMACTYALMGAVIALIGSNLQIIMQSKPIIIVFSLLFIGLAFSMFGFFELRIPLSSQTKIAQVGRSFVRGHYLSAIVMGCLSTLILSPCVTAPLLAILGYIAQSGNVVLGALSLFFLSLGMGTPLILIGTSFSYWLPKAGQWMNAVNYFFGFILLALAIYLLSRVLNSAIIMFFWGSLLVFAGIYSGALVPAVVGAAKFRQATGLILLVYGVLILIGASMGETNPLHPLKVQLGEERQILPLSKAREYSLPSLNQALKAAQGRPILLDFYADWCISCKIIEESLLKNKQVLSALEGFAIFKVDITANTPENKALMKEYGVIAPPAFLFFSSKGQGLKDLDLVGEIEPEVFVQRLNRAASAR